MNLIGVIQLVVMPLLVGAVGLAFVRLVRGPSLPDRVDRARSAVSDRDRRHGGVRHRDRPAAFSGCGVGPGPDFLPGDGGVRLLHRKEECAQWLTW